MGKTVAVLGSSGGNLYSQGGNDPQRMFSEIMTQARSAGMEIVCVLFIGTDKSMDGIAMDAKAKLYTLSGAAIEPGEEKTLAEINQDAKRLDSELAAKIDAGEIDGLIVMSCDPTGVNRESIAAAARKGLPVVGTGGTSIANITP